MLLINLVNYIFLTVLNITIIADQPLIRAFPGAEGFGKYATGGRGGKIAEVTNLDDDGEGSFRQALKQFPDTPITIIFKVSGTIELKTDIKVNRSDITIAGQTAPGDGICLKNRSIIINGASNRKKGNHGNIIIRYLRSRPGGTAAKGLYGIDIENCHDIILDHCSFSWANEECVAIYDTRNTTVQWCIISEGLYNAGHAKGNRSYCGVWGGQNASYHHNLIVNQNSRTVRFNGSRAHDTLALVDYRNNVIYNWGSANACYGGDVNIAGGRSSINMVNNYYFPGPATAANLKFAKADYDIKKAKGYGIWYLHGNVMKGNDALSNNNKTGIDLTELPSTEKSKAVADRPFIINRFAEITMQSAKEAFKIVLKNAGANYPKSDGIDQRIFQEIRTNNPSGMGTFGKPGIIDSPAAVGGWSVYSSVPCPADTDHDGMPDKWELSMGLNPENAEDRNETDKTGYTMIEVYLAKLVKK